MECTPHDEVDACQTSTVKDAQCKGHPRLTDSCVDHWTKWDEWTPGLKDSFQEFHIEKLEIFTLQKLQAFMSLDAELIGSVNIPAVSFPEEPPEHASYEEKQKYLIDSYTLVMDIALPKNLDRRARKQRLLQTSLTQYRSLYQELRLKDPTTTIRLLEILPGSPEGPVISTRLFNASLHSLDRPYEAISYTWGTVTSPREMRSIRVNSFNLPVTPNLYNALISLRQLNAARTVWVDSVCINQGDLNERREQVLLIAHIYAKSERTVVFLGPSTATTEAFFAFLALPICQLSHCEKCQKGHGQASWHQPPLEACVEAGLDEQDVLDGFVEVCSMPWWTRVWILQEFMLSRSDPLLYCGRDTVSNRQLTANLDRISSWIHHRKTHPQPVYGCAACGGKIEKQADDVSEDGSEDEQHSASSETREATNDFGDDQSVASGNRGDVEETVMEIIRRRLEGLRVDPRSTNGHEWNMWGARVWLVESVLARRTLCRPWNNAPDVYKNLKSNCSDPHDIVYGVRELTDHAFRDMFIPDYTISVADLYTKLATYLIVMEYWSDIFWHFPHRLKDKYPRGSQESTNIPSWVPDFTRPVKPKEADRVTYDKPRPVKSNPFIIDRVAFFRGWVLDEIFQVFPLPNDDPFRLLQQLWYIERTHGWAPYELMSGKPSYNLHDWDNPKDMEANLRRFHPFPSVAWATDESRSSDGRSIVQTLEAFMDLSGLMEAMDSGYRLVKPCLQRIFDREGKCYGPSASREDNDEFRRRRTSMSERLRHLMLGFMHDGDRRTDFVGICTFDFEGLRAQVLHHLLPMTPWQPLRMNRPKFVNEEADNICNPPIVNANLQRPIVYRSLLALINNDIEDIEERIMRREVIMNFAQVVHDAAMELVGGRSEVTYECLGHELADIEKCIPQSHDRLHADHSLQNDDASTAGGCVDVIVDHFVLLQLHGGVDDRSRPDGPLILYHRDEADDDRLVEKVYFDEVGQPLGPGVFKDARSFSTMYDRAMMSEPMERNGNQTYIDDLSAPVNEELCSEPQSPDDNPEDRKSTEEAQSDYLSDSAASTQGELEEVTDANDDAYSIVSSLEQSRTSQIYGGPSGKLTTWRRTEKRKSTQVHLVFQDLCDFLAGREFFITETGLLGLTAPGVRGVCDGDDLLMLQDMTFPIVARLEPSEKLGNPKMRRRSMSTLRMRREIVGSAIVRGIDTKDGHLDKVDFPEHFVPLSSMDIGLLRIK
ncbi:unnamed protein product [Clonostachys rosea]|uniref:Heterokaryon incompatibility domain-containing protein n=1 Tax=Bionectria ochroleuca TaxID=29856 RepID=A0ABY6UG34_BIOOC|nr:unnamed protein product [Clonostachys rosea]